MKRWVAVLLVFAAVVFGSCANSPRPKSAAPLRVVHDVDLQYVQEGKGAAVVFVHGPWMDLRYWEPQRKALGSAHQFIAYNHRYHGTAPWPDEGSQYSVDTHVSDLAALIRKLGIAPAHLVGVSSGGLVALRVALEHPELVRSLTLVEPTTASLLPQTDEARAVLEERGKVLTSIAAAVQAGDSMKATTLFFEWVNNRGEGSLAEQPESVRQMVADNARTVPLLLSALRASCVLPERRPHHGSDVARGGRANTSVLQADESSRDSVHPGQPLGGDPERQTPHVPSKLRGIQQDADGVSGAALRDGRYARESLVGGVRHQLRRAER